MISKSLLKFISTGCIIAPLCAGSIIAQTPSDAVMMEAGEICVGVNYNHSAWDEYWEGDSLRTNENIGTLTTQAVTAGFMLGIMDRVNILAMLPYVATNPSAGVVAGDKGLQDISLFLKVNALEKTVGPGNLKLLASAGIAIPLGSYIAENPFAIGLGCPDGIFRGIVHYDVNNGIYARVDAVYHLRGSSEIVRNYYYTTQGYLTSEIDMPNALDYNATAGYITKNKHIKAEAVLSGLTTFGGFDIRRQDGGFPSNNMEVMRIGINADYYDLFVKGFAVHLYSNYVLDGRNVGKSTMIGGGLSYQFPVWKAKEKTTVETPKEN